MRRFLQFASVTLLLSCVGIVLFSARGEREFSNSVSAQAAGNTFYVATNGNDTNAGSESAPFKTFDKARRVLKPGDTLKIFGGTYSEPINFTISGTSDAWISIEPVSGQKVIIDVNRAEDRAVWLRGNYLRIANIEVKNADWSCLVLSGQYQQADRMTATGCVGHGIFTDGQYVSITNSTVYGAVLENQSRQPENSWGSAIKVGDPGENVTIDGNTVYHNYGEGIAVTQGKNARITNNLVYDNFSVNIYIDNSINVLVESNIASCTDYEGFTRGGNRPAALALAEESYSGWGAQLKNITIQNNVLAFCYFGIADFGAEVANGGLDSVLIQYNTVWGNVRNQIYLDSEAVKTRNTVIARNIFQTIASSTAPSIKNLPGITKNDNYWVTSLPASSTNALGTNDRAGTVNFANNPSYSNFTSFMQTNTSPAKDYGVRFGTTSTPTLAPQPTATLVPTKTPTLTPVPTTRAQPIVTQAPTRTPSTTIKLGDLNQDGQVNSDDVSLLLTVYGKKSTAKPSADLNGDGVINAVDYAGLLSLLGN